MTRTELKSKANMLMRGPYWDMEQVNNCKCWLIYSPDRSLAIVQSYRTAVAIYSARTRILYVFDFYSHTTQQHIRKAVKLLGTLEIRYLYQRSDSVIVYLAQGNVNFVRKTPKEREYIIDSDYDIYIENDWNY